MEHTAKMCPYKLGPCWEHGCQLWKEAISDCGLKRLGPQDEVIAELKAHLVEVDGMLKAETEAGERYEARAQQLESELASRLTQKDIEDLQADLEAALSVGTKLVGDKEELEVEVQQLKFELASRPTREELSQVMSERTEAESEAETSREELEDARQELETLRAQGGRKSRRKKESSVGGV